jgi:UDP-N-acetylmuramoylalanine--D-glutamate ligase
VSFDRWRGTEREVAVVGLARSGVAAARLLRREGIRVYASDQAAVADQSVGAQALHELGRLGVAVQLGGHDLARIGRAVAVVVSPGVPPEAPPIGAARSGGVEVISEIDLGREALRGTRLAAITGTNGKTTTTALTAHLLQAAGFHTVAAGNIGLPLAEVALAPTPPEWIALEISSFQLHDTHHLEPDIGVLTNLAPDHLDRYATVEDYYADKARLFCDPRPHAAWVTNADDPVVQAMVDAVPGRKLGFSIRSRSDAWYDRAGRRLMIGDHAVLAREELRLLGDHNVANALAATLVATLAGGALERTAEGLRSFRALPHRLEPVREVDGVLWINDSKATNLASTAVALEALERPFVLLLGGRHKGEPYTGLAQAMGGRCRAVVAFGESKDLIFRDLAGQVTLIAGGSFPDVMQKARSAARPGDAVLLSPACSSYDMFRNYEDRGAQFRAAVEAM